MQIMNACARAACVQGIAWDKKWDGELGQASLNYQLSMGDTVARPDAQIMQSSARQRGGVL